VTEVDPRWYDGFFEAEWLDYVQPDADVTLRQVDFLGDELALAPGDAVLDVACGRGRHSVELARRGFHVTGVDLSACSLELARAAAEQARAEVVFRRLDMRELDYDGVFDAVVNLFTAFGYFWEDLENERVVHRIVSALRPGGRVVIDTINPIALARVFRAREWHELEDGSVLLEQRSHDQLRGRIRGTWTLVRRDGSRSVREHSLRAYSPAELSALLSRAGLEVERALGSFDRTPLGDGTRTILLARKRESGNGP
jgi:SAM-dependent methyltransferase